MVATETVRADKFVRGLKLDLQGFVQAFNPTTYVDAQRLAVDMSLHESVDTSKTVGKGSTSGQKRKAKLQPTIQPQWNLGAIGVFQRHRQEIVEAENTLKELPVCRSCGRSHGRRCLVGNGVWKNTYHYSLGGRARWHSSDSVIDTRELEVSLSSESVVKEYPDVFLNELPRLSPNEEIDFTIELEPDTVPLSRAPYRMVSAKLKWLKVQLHELLDKGYHQMRIKDSDVSKVVFRFRYGHSLQETGVLPTLKNVGENKKYVGKAYVDVYHDVDINVGRIKSGEALSIPCEYDVENASPDA
ncbi:gag-protease polyprotein [Cucumis melo var. makuwa]|uniref:Gag-protease polyprotein n=1 Tax=Cucumis melo var. makuwa TaxID=1194695 RepID=A0A5D3DTD2_CUCMM|nr:gag-protease polyprotein [Cucumis melo var. makuwa]TYK26788.1 gag-protease polyprotein [Cucumis melo var. makuwa]